VARFYGLNPLELPGWFLDVLLDSMEPVQAGERRLGLLDNRAALYGKVSSLERLLYQLDMAARPWPEPPPAPSVPDEERDPVKAAEWFRSQGVLVEPTPDKVKKNGPH
jgi:hypothetical protein